MLFILYEYLFFFCREARSYTPLDFEIELFSLFPVFVPPARRFYERA